MSSAKDETMASNENWKKAGGKTKRGKPVGRREVFEKYKSVGLDTLRCRNRKQVDIKDRVLNCHVKFIPREFLKERRRANELALQDQMLSLDDDDYREEDEDKARKEVGKMKFEIRRDLEHAVALELAREWLDMPMRTEDIEWFGTNYGDNIDEYVEILYKLMCQSPDEETGSYISYYESLWLISLHCTCDNCPVLEILHKYRQVRRVSR